MKVLTFAGVSWVFLESGCLAPPRTPQRRLYAGYRLRQLSLSKPRDIFEMRQLLVDERAGFLEGGLFGSGMLVLAQ